MTKWEYRITQEEVVGPSYAYTGGLDTMFNEWGEQGWELVAMLAEEGPATVKYEQVMIYTCTFKRPIPDLHVPPDDSAMVVLGQRTPAEVPA